MLFCQDEAVCHRVVSPMCTAFAGVGAVRVRQAGDEVFCCGGGNVRLSHPWYYGFYQTLTKSPNQVEYFQIGKGKGWYSYKDTEDAQTSPSAPASS